jgi:hypothetical protein
VEKTPEGASPLRQGVGGSRRQGGDTGRLLVKIKEVDPAGPAAVVSVLKPPVPKIKESVS